ncbi:MAG: hypothetical protein CL503_03660 [Actinobacteria bacterium]|nr:hypothetical protein [Actinomycetota bacterium]
MRVCSIFFVATTLIGSLHGGKSKPPHPIKGSRISDSRVTQGKSNEFYKAPFSKTPFKQDKSKEFYKAPFSKTPSKIDSRTPTDKTRSKKDDSNLPHTHPFGYHPHF